MLPDQLRDRLAVSHVPIRKPEAARQRSTGKAPTPRTRLSPRVGRFALVEPPSCDEQPVKTDSAQSTRSQALVNQRSIDLSCSEHNHSDSATCPEPHPSDRRQAKRGHLARNPIAHRAGKDQVDRTEIKQRSGQQEPRRAGRAGGPRHPAASARRRESPRPRRPEPAQATESPRHWATDSSNVPA